MSSASFCDPGRWRGTHNVMIPHWRKQKTCDGGSPVDSESLESLGVIEGPGFSPSWSVIKPTNNAITSDSEEFWGDF